MKGVRVISDAGRGAATHSLGERVFDTLVYRRRHWASETYEQRYRVYKTETECVIVNANSAKEAIEVAGFDHPFKVIRGQASTVGPGLLVKEGRLIDEDMTPERDAEAKSEDALAAPNAKPESNVDPDPDSEPEMSAEDLPETPSEAD